MEGEESKEQVDDIDVKTTPPLCKADKTDYGGHELDFVDPPSNRFKFLPHLRESSP